MVAERPQENWAVYSTEMDEKAAVIMVDLALRPLVPMADRPQLFNVHVTMQRPRENGLTSQEEAETALYPLEDAVVAAIQNAETGAVQVGKITHNGAIDLYFYAPSPASPSMFGKLFGKKATGLADRLHQAMKAFPSYVYQYLDTDEPQWEAYLQLLYPGGWELQMIMNERVVRALAAQGDRADQPRDVDHFIVCPDATVQSSIVAEAEKLGFRAEAQPADDRGTYAINVYSHGTLNDIDQMVWPLFEMAEHYGATYDGWGATVEK